ncbi:MAG TPA: elongation factor G [Dongiaceae bacterium]|nr:elongation factor G [Dongiaceae bacterium]
MPGRAPAAPRCAAIVGPYLSGKTALLESLLFATGAITRKGNAKDGTTVGDSSPEAKARKMSVECAPAVTQYLNETWSFIDCPGSVELAQDARNALLVCDVAIVVAEPLVDKALTLAPLFKFLDDNKVPHILFINKMDQASHPVRDIMAALQGVSARPLVLRQVPIRAAGKDSDDVTGYVDLISERAYKYHPGQESDLIKMPEEVLPREQEARTGLLERLADFDDHLMEELLSDVVPAKDEIYQQLSKDLAEDLIVPVMLGAAEKDSGVHRLLKALRHDVPGPEATAKRLGIEGGEPTAIVFKTSNQQHAGKLSLVRVFGGKIADGATLNGQRVSGILKPKGHAGDKVPAANAGELAAFGRLEHAKTGDILTTSGKAPAGFKWPDPMRPLFSLAIDVENRNDEVKLTAALAKLSEDDPSLTFDHDPDTHELLLYGQGEVHLNIAFDRLKSRFNLPVKHRRPSISYRETIRGQTKQHARFKRQSGGHGQFADVQVEIWPQTRGAGFEFHDRVVGGAVPRTFIGSVEEGIRDYLQRGPLGFPVVDVAASLFDGQYHAVDSSDMAFKTAARMAMQEGMPKCTPVLLEPIYAVEISAPNEFTAKVHNLITGRRGQILNFGAKDDWQGWDKVEALLPQTELHDMIIELRSLTLGVGNFAYRFDHLQELTGRLADKVVEQRNAATAAH